MYESARSRVCVGCNLSEEFSVKEGIHQGSCLSPLLFITVLEALSQELLTRCPGENLYANDLVSITESRGITTEADPLEDQHGRKGTSGQHGHNQGPDIWARAQRASEVWQRPLWHVSQGHQHKFHYLWWLFQFSWIHKKCSGILGHLKFDVSFRCEWCTGEARLKTEVTVGRDKLEVVPSFWYFGDCLSSGGGCELATMTRCCVAWDKFKELLPVLTSRSFSSPPEEEFTIRVSGVPCSVQAKPGPQPYPTCIACNIMTKLLFAWCAESPQRTKSAHRVSVKDAAWWSGKGTPHRWLRWHGHLKRSDGWLKKVQKLNPTGGHGRGHHKKTWTEVIDMDRLMLGLTETHPSGRKAWTSRLKSAVRLDPPLY